MSFQHLFHVWSVPVVTIAFLTGCGPTHLSIDSPLVNPRSTIDIALDALRIWGKSKAPNFIGMALWNKAILAYSAKRM